MSDPLTQHLDAFDRLRRSIIEECAIVAETYKALDPETVRMISYRVEIAKRIRALADLEQGTP